MSQQYTVKESPCTLSETFTLEEAAQELCNLIQQTHAVNEFLFEYVNEDAPDSKAGGLQAQVTQNLKRMEHLSIALHDGFFFAKAGRMEVQE